MPMRRYRPRISGVDQSILYALERGPISGTLCLTNAIGCTPNQDSYVIARAKRLESMQLIRIHGKDAACGRGHKMIFALPGHVVQLQNGSKPLSPLKSRILQCLGDRSVWQDRELRRWIQYHHGYKDAAIYVAIRDLAKLELVLLATSGGYYGRRHTIWTVQAAHTASKKESRPPQPGFKVIVRARAADLFAVIGSVKADS